MTTEKDPVQKAQELARVLGDEDWKRGKTKLCLEAWEASDISPGELYGKAEALIGAIKLNNAWSEELTKLNEEEKDSAHITMSGKTCTCAQCERYVSIETRYYGELRKLLGWDEHAPIGHKKVSLSDYTAFYRSAAVACLRTIKRMNAVSR